MTIKTIVFFLFETNLFKGDAEIRINAKDIDLDLGYLHYCFILSDRD